MQKIKGKHTEAVVCSDTADHYALAQVKMICDNEAAAESKICLMPDIHPGKIGPVGLTMTLKDKVIPGLVGVDIGCGISYMKIKNERVEYQKLDKVIRSCIPSGSKIRKETHHLSRDFDFSDLVCRKHINENKALLSLGTLGGGNHFIELDVNDDGHIYVVVHSGSRHLGVEVAEHYMREGQRYLKAEGISVPYEMTYLEGSLMEDYLHDIAEVQGFAMLNREIMLTQIAKEMKWKVAEYGESIHNYVDENRILRKGASSAYKGDTVIIPINMRDGILIGKGLGNEEWNFSAPHGAGRIMNREAVKTSFTVSQYKEQMKGIYSTCIAKDTLDEAPFAYRGIKEISEAIKDTVNIVKVIKSVYNFKAGGKE